MATGVGNAYLVGMLFFFNEPWIIYLDRVGRDLSPVSTTEYVDVYTSATALATSNVYVCVNWSSIHSSLQNTQITVAKINPSVAQIENPAY